MNPDGTLLLSREDIQAMLGMDDHLNAVESAFRLHAEGRALPSGLLHVDAPCGEFHIKAGGLQVGQPYFALKANAGFRRNRERYGLPNILGTILLCDADKGVPLALMDSVAITVGRTAAATAAAARRLANPESCVVTICGCGTQGRGHLRFLKHVLPLSRAHAYSRTFEQAGEFAAEMSAELGIEVLPVRDLPAALGESQVCITCTPAREPFVRCRDVPRGMFIAAVGADSPGKQELESELLVGSTVVVDLLGQAVQVGELQHAIREGLVSRESVHAELGEILSGRKSGRATADEIIVFDSTGTALQDTAAALAAYERALATGRGHRFDFLRCEGRPGLAE